MISSSLFLPAVLHPAIPLGEFFPDCILVFLLYLFVAFQFYEIHFETRKHEPLRTDNPIQDSHCRSRITFVITRRVLMSVLLSLAEHLSYFSG